MNKYYSTDIRGEFGLCDQAHLCLLAGVYGSQAPTLPQRQEERDPNFPDYISKE